MQVVSTSGALTRRGLLARDIQAYALWEEITGGLIYFILTISPWAFGSTQPWSIWVVNGCGYGLGVGLWFKWYIRRIKMYRRTTGKEPPDRIGNKRLFCGPVLVRILGTLTVSILLYCLISALNARATVNPATGQLEYKNCIEWLPHSFDSASTLQVFARLVALACFFWALRDWVVHGPAARTGGARVMSIALPWRIASMLWVLSISGALLALEGIVQRLVGSPKLLFLLKPEIHQEAATQFASFAYRANAAQYFNLLWPVTLGFAWMLHREQRGPSGSAYLLVCCAGLMAACPIISGARGAALVDLGMLLFIVTALLAHCLFEALRRSRSRKESIGLLLLFCAGTLLLGGGLGWKQLRLRLAHATADLQERQELYERARQMAKDYALFGTGPGTFERVFQLYRTSAESYWPAQLHNDWLETRITYGRIGSALIAAALLVIAWHWITSGPLPSRPNLALYLWLALAGCLIQARWDFPLQVYSIVLLFVCWWSLLFSIGEAVTERPKHAQGISPSTSGL